MQDVLDPVIKASTITIKTGWKFNPVNKYFYAPADDPTFSFKHFTKAEKNVSVIYDNANLLLADKETRDSITYQGRCMYYERGKDTIHGFGWMGDYGVTWEGANKGEITFLKSYADTDLNTNYYDDRTKYVNHVFSLGYSPTVYFELDKPNDGDRTAYLINVGNTYFQVNYIPDPYILFII